VIFRFDVFPSLFCHIFFNPFTEIHFNFLSTLKHIYILSHFHNTIDEIERNFRRFKSRHSSERITSMEVNELLIANIFHRQHKHSLLYPFVVMTRNLIKTKNHFKLKSRIENINYTANPSTKVIVATNCKGRWRVCLFRAHLREAFSGSSSQPLVEMKNTIQLNVFKA